MPVRPLTPELAEKARLELNEDPKHLQDGIAYLRDWISKQPHLRARTDEQWLAAFLRGCKFSLERTKEKIDLYYSLRSTAPELSCVKYSDPRCKVIFQHGFQIMLPKAASPTSPKVAIIRPGACDPAKFKITEVLSVSYIKQQLSLLNDDQMVVCGATSILDLEGCTMGHFAQMTPSLMKKMVVSGQDATPIRMKGVHYLNTPPGFETIFNFMKTLLNEKNRTRLHVHNKNYEALYQHVPKEILPVEYGGSGGTVQEIKDHWWKEIEAHKDWLEEDLQFGTDEARRPGKPRTAEEMFGIDGSFRQLEFD